MLRILLLFSLLLFGCSRVDDGPISVFSDDDLLAVEEGFFYSGFLDSNSSIHLFDDSLAISLDSIWTFSNCALSEIIIESSLEDDSLLLLAPRFLLKKEVEDCAAPLFRPDTTISFSIKSFEKVREIRLVNTKKRELDSILVRHGEILKEKQTFYIDSSIANPYMWPYRISDDTSGILRVLDSQKVVSYYWKKIEGVCLNIQDSCSQMQLDTLFPSTLWNSKDTLLIPVISKCQDTSKTFCLDKDWNYDSLNTSSSILILDTTWFSSVYYMGPKESCSELLSLTILSNFVLKSNFSFQTEIFVPSEKETYCDEKLISDKIIYDLGLLKSVDDSLKAKVLLDQWDSAYVEKSIDQEK